MNKKIIVIVVLLECVLAILLVSFLGKAIETYFNEVSAREICFLDEKGVPLEDDDIIDVERWDLGYQLRWRINPEKTTDKSITFTSSKPDKVTVDESGYVSFDEEVDVSITASTSNGMTATIKLVPKRKTEGTVNIDKNNKKE